MGFVPKWLAWGLVLVVAGTVGVAVTSARSASRWRAEVAALTDSVQARRAAAVAEDARLRATLDRLAERDTQLRAATAYSTRLAREAAALRRARQDVVIIPSEPGLPPTVGDTLRACRQSVLLCEQEADVERQRADSATVALSVLQGDVGTLRSDVAHWRQSWATDRALLDHATALLQAADAPCYLVRLGPVKAHCPTRRDAALWTAAGLLALHGRRESRYAAGGLVLVSLVW